MFVWVTLKSTSLSTQVRSQKYAQPVQRHSFPDYLWRSTLWRTTSWGKRFALCVERVSVKVDISEYTWKSIKMANHINVATAINLLSDRLDWRPMKRLTIVPESEHNFELILNIWIIVIFVWGANKIYPSQTIVIIVANNLLLPQISDDNYLTFPKQIHSFRTIKLGLPNSSNFIKLDKLWEKTNRVVTSNWQIDRG